MDNLIIFVSFKSFKTQKGSHIKLLFMKRKCILFLILIMMTGGVFAQRITVRGTVTSVMEDNISMPGVTIMVRGTTQGTITDVDGRYVIEVEPDATLVFSYVGMETQEIPVQGRTIIDVGLRMDIARLGEVVVVGYGTESSRLISGSLGVVGEGEIRDVPLRTVDGVLQGRSAGVQISQSSGNTRICRFSAHPGQQLHNGRQRTTLCH
jgi:TonB-dependent starch-binding outer membrane protein SusC